jgi:hypothetical protein
MNIDAAEACVGSIRCHSHGLTRDDRTCAE